MQRTEVDGHFAAAKPFRFSFEDALPAIKGGSAADAGLGSEAAFVVQDVAGINTLDLIGEIDEFSLLMAPNVLPNPLVASLADVETATTKAARMEGVVWSPCEDTRLLASISAFGACKWVEHAACVTGKNAKQCRERWTNHIDPSLDFGPWTRVENAKIKAMYEAVGSRWSLMAKNLPGRCSNHVKNHFYSRIRRTIDDYIPPVPLAERQRLGPKTTQISRKAQRGRNMLRASSVARRIDFDDLDSLPELSGPPELPGPPAGGLKMTTVVKVQRPSAHLLVLAQTTRPFALDARNNRFGRMNAALRNFQRKPKRSGKPCGLACEHAR